MTRPRAKVFVDGGGTSFDVIAAFFLSSRIATAVPAEIANTRTTSPIDRSRRRRGALDESRSDVGSFIGHVPRGGVPVGPGIRATTSDLPLSSSSHQAMTISPASVRTIAGRV